MVTRFLTFWRDVLADFPLIRNAESRAFSSTFVCEIVGFRNPEINHSILLPVKLMNLVRPPIRVLYELTPNWMTSANPTFGNLFTVTDHPNLRRDHGREHCQSFSDDATIFSSQPELWYKSFIMLWKLKPYWLWSAINRSVVGVD